MQNTNCFHMGKYDSYFALNENSNLKRLFLLLFAAVIIGLLVIFRYYFWPFLMALILYLALKPFHDRVFGIVKKRSLSASIVVVLLILLILAPIILLLIALTDQAYQLYVIVERELNAQFFHEVQKLPFFATIMDNLDINEAEIIARISSFIQTTAGKLISSLTSVVSYPISFAINFFFMLLMLFFLFKDGYNLGSAFYKVLPFPDDLEKSVVDRLKEVIKVLLAGNLLIMVLQGSMVGISLAIAGIGMPLLWGSIAAILSLIPVVGTTLIWLPAAIYLIAGGSYISGIFVGVWCLAWYLLLENLLKPKIFGEKLNFHPVVFFFLLLGSIQAFNLPGVIIGPILLTLFYSLWEIYKLLQGYGNLNENDE